MSDDELKTLAEFVRSHCFVLQMHLVDAWALGYLDVLVQRDELLLEELLKSLPSRAAELLDPNGAFVTFGMDRCRSVVNELSATLLDSCATLDEMVEMVARLATNGTCLEVESSPALSGFLRDYSQLGLAFRHPFVGDQSAPTTSTFTADIERAVLRTGVSDKKSHEVLQMAAFLAKKVSSLSQVETRKIVLVDVGAGQGYLAAAMCALGNTVVVIERDSNQVHGVMRRYSGIEAFGGRLVVCNASVGAATMACDLEGTVCAALGAKAGSVAFVMYSLHACGDLSTDILRLFTEWPACRAVVNVGCCYNLMAAVEQRVVSVAGATLAADIASPCCGATPAALAPLRFPVSTAVQAAFGDGTATAICTRNVLMCACQAPRQWLKSDLAGAFGSVRDRAFVQAVLKSAFGIADLDVIGRLPQRQLQRQHDEIDAPREQEMTGKQKQKFHNRGKQLSAAAAKDETHSARDDENQTKRSRKESTAQQDESIEQYCHRCIKVLVERNTDMASVADLSLSRLDQVIASTKARLIGGQTATSPSCCSAQLIAAYFVKAAVGHVLESLILEDRAAFVRERVDSQHCDVRLEAIFDHKKSARNVAVVALRTP